MFPDMHTLSMSQMQRIPVLTATDEAFSQPRLSTVRKRSDIPQSLLVSSHILMWPPPTFACGEVLSDSASYQLILSACV